MNAPVFGKSAKGLILASGLIAASTVMGYAQDAPVALGTQATVPLSALYVSAPSGITTLGGHTFDLSGGNLISLGSGQSASFNGSWANAQGAFLLLNTMNTYWWFDGSQVGTVTLTFSDGTSQTTNLTVGANIREWKTGSTFTVNTITDAATAQVWSGSSVDGKSAVIDMLTINLAGSTKTLTNVTVSNTNGFGSLRIDLAGLTIDPKTATYRPGNSGSTPAAQNSQAPQHAQSANFSGTPTAPGQLAKLNGTPANQQPK